MKIILFRISNLSFTLSELISSNSFFHFQDSFVDSEVKTRVCGEFVMAAPIPGTVLLNVVPLLERWTAGLLNATVYRILVPEDMRRYKTRQALLLFLHPDDECIVKCTRVVPKVPLHSLFCLDNTMSDLTTLMITKYYI